MRPLSRRLSLFLVLASFAPLAFGQGTISGTVTDRNTGDPIPGVNVILQGLNQGSATDVDGNYTIENVPAGEHQLQARFVGYRTQDETVDVADGETQTVNFEMGEDALQLDELVVTGAGGPVEKRKLGNSIASIDVNALESAPIQSFSDILQGREPGLVGLPSGGLAGEGSRIRIRGNASLSQTNEPVVYVDGVRVDRGGGFGGAVGSGGGGSPSRLDDINPEAIARVEVLKGAAAATLYGTEASNGVIQIFTKKGEIGPPRFSFQVQQGASWAPDVYPDNVGFARSLVENGQTLTAQQVADTLSLYHGRDIAPYELVSSNYGRDLLGTGYTQAYSGSVSGGTPGITYFVGGRFFSDNGPYKGDLFTNPVRQYAEGVQGLAADINRKSQATATISAFPTDNFTLRVTTNYARGYLETLQSNNNIYGILSLAQFSKPELVRYNNSTGTIAFATVNEAMQQTVAQNVEHFTGSSQFNYRPLDNLNLDATFGIDVVNQVSEEFRPFGWNIDNKTSSEVTGARTFSDRNFSEITLDSKATLDNEFGEKFESTLLVGVQGFITENVIESGIGRDFPGPGFGVTEAAATQQVEEVLEEVVNAGVFFQEQVGYNNFLFATVGGRYDANSAFGSDFNGVFYPKIQGSFIPSDAPFWKPSRAISSLRFRAALGRSGLQPGAFDALTTYTALTATSGPGIIPLNLGNENLKPEISTEFEIGTEAGFLDGLIALEMTYWNRTVSDALVARQFPVTGGFRATQLDNVGELKAQGLEIALNAVAIEGRRTSLDLFVNASYLWQEVTDLGGAPPIKVGGSYPRYRNYLIEGYAPGAHFGAQLQDVGDGLVPFDFDGDGNPDTRESAIAYLGGLSLDEAAEAGLPNTTSLVLLKQEGGNPDINAPLNQYLGKPTPDWQGSFGGSLTFLENFTLSTLFEYKFGNYYINNLTDAFRHANPSIGRNTPEAAEIERDFLTGGIDGSMNPQNSGEVRLAATEEWVNNYLALAPFSGLNTIKSADWLRLRELSLTYTFLPSMASRVGLRELSFTVAGRNLFLWTKYDGVDPELNAVGRGSGDQLDQNYLDGVEAFGIPIPRRVIFTVRATL